MREILHPSRRAFTLIEVLIAMVIVGMITAGLAVSLSIAFKARRSATDGLNTIRSARLGLDAVGHDLQSALPPTGIFASSFIGTSAAAPSPGSADTSTTSDSLTFSNTADPIRLGDGASDIQQVTLLVVPDSDVLATPQTPSPPNQPTPQSSVASSTNVVGPHVAPPAGVDGMLVRQVSRQLLAPVAPTATTQVLCRHVQAFNLRYYDGTQWLQSWDSTANNNALPVAVEATLQVAAPPTSIGAQPPSTRIVRVYSIPCVDVNAISGTSSSGSTPTNP